MVFRNTFRAFNVVVVQSLSRVQLFVTPWTVARQASLSFTISQSFLKLIFIESVVLSNQLILCHLLLFLPSVFLSIRVFSMSRLFTSGGQSWSFSFSISLFSEYSGFDFLEVQGTLKSLLQQHSSKASFLWHSSSLWGSTLTSVHDYWANHNLDYTELCRQSDVFV